MFTYAMGLFLKYHAERSNQDNDGNYNFDKTHVQSNKAIVHEQKMMIEAGKPPGHK